MTENAFDGTEKISNTNTNAGSFTTVGHGLRPTAADSDWSLMKSTYFITAALVDRFAADDVATLVCVDAGMMRRRHRHFIWMVALAPGMG